MPTQALILVNGVAGSNDNVPINTPVTLANNNLGGEITWAWTILDQPPGAADALTSTNTSSTGFTPKKEGTYLIRVDVNFGLPDEALNQVVVAVRDLKTFERVPAAGETAEDSSTVGWAPAVDSILRRSLGLAADAGVIVATAGQTISQGQAVSFASAGTIKTGLPGQEYLPVATLAAANSAGTINSVVGVMLARVSDGATTANSGDIVRIRLLGLGGPFNGNLAAGTALYVADNSSLSVTPGTIERRIGTVVLSVNGGTQYLALIDGLGMLSARAVNDLVAVSLAITGAFSAGATGTTFSGAVALSGGSPLTGTPTVTAASIVFTAAGIQSLLKASGAFQIGTSDSDELDFIINGANVWSILSTGVLKAQGANRAIQGVLDPVSAQDVATKNYVDTTGGEGVLAWGNETLPTGASFGDALDPWWNNRQATSVLLTGQIVIPRAGAIHDLFISAIGSGGTTAETYTLYKNGSATALSVTLGAGAGSANLTGTSVTVAAGDTLQLRFSSGATPHSGISASTRFTNA